MNFFLIARFCIIILAVTSLPTLASITTTMQKKFSKKEFFSIVQTTIEKNKAVFSLLCNPEQFNANQREEILKAFTAFGNCSFGSREGLLEKIRSSAISITSSNQGSLHECYCLLYMIADRQAFLNYKCRLKELINTTFKTYCVPIEGINPLRTSDVSEYLQSSMQRSSSESGVLLRLVSDSVNVLETRNPLFSLSIYIRLATSYCYLEKVQEFFKKYFPIKVCSLPTYLTYMTMLNTIEKVWRKVGGRNIIFNDGRKQEMWGIDRQAADMEHAAALVLMNRLCENNNKICPHALKPVESYSLSSKKALIIHSYAQNDPESLFGKLPCEMVKHILPHVRWTWKDELRRQLEGKRYMWYQLLEKVLECRTSKTSS